MMINNLDIIEIPIWAHLKTFVLKHLYPHHREGAIKVDEDSLLGKSVMAALITKNSIKKSTGLLRYEFTETISVKLSARMMDRSPRPHNLAMVNWMLDIEFRSHLFIWIKSHKLVGYSAKKACENFISFYGLQDVYTFDAAHRAWLRYANDEYSKERAALKQKRDEKKRSTLVS
jgi:hypothetical protein